ncbi:MAG: ComEC/Rec2 family competence protein [Chloroflexia bacterium]
MPLVPLACAWLAGVLLGVFWPGARPDASWPVLGLALLSAGALALLWADRRARWAGLLAVALWLGLARSLLALPPPTPAPDSLRALNVSATEARHAAGPRVQVRGRVLADPDPAHNGKASQVRVAAEAVFQDGAWRPATGGLLAVAGPFPGVVQGDLVECAGVLQDPPPVPGFDYATWLSRHGIESYMDHAQVRLLASADAPTSLLAGWRRDAGTRAAGMLPEPEAGLLRGILLGQRKAPDPALRQDFSSTGTSWILVVSGVHLSIFLFFGYLVLRRWLAPWPSAVIAGALVAGYAAFVGLGLPVARATLMGLLYLIAQGLGRPPTPINLLAVAALVLTCLDPLSVADAGFQLSFAAVAGILLFAPPLAAHWHRLPLLGEACAIAVAVQITIWPLEAAQFGSLYPLEVPAGVAGGLLLQPILLLGSAQTLAAWLLPPLGQVLAWLCWLPLAALAGMVHLVASLPFASLPLPGFGAPGILAWYALLALAYLLADPKRRAQARSALLPQPQW